MEVSSSTTASTLQDNTSLILPHTATPEASTGPVVSSSDTESDGLNSAVSKEPSVGTLEVRYGPALPPSVYPTESASFSKDVRDSKAVPGCCGLHNLGNTCFMNAGIQSLMSCAPLVKFFCENYTLSEGNRHTLTGHFYVLLCKIWSGKFSVVHPRKFKEFLGFYHSQFEDYRQHDCQEFLALLLDTLHEQLNYSAVGKHTYMISPLPVSSSSSSTAPSLLQGKSNNPSAISTTSNSESMLLAAGEHCGEGDASDLNNKDPSLTVRTPILDSESGESVCRKSARFLSFAQPVSASTHDLSSPSDESPNSEVSLLDSLATSPSSHLDVVCHKSPDHSEEDIISSSYPSLRRYTSRSNLEDVTSSDSGILMKTSLKRVSSGNSVTACGPNIHSEDSNHSTVSAHSTDSEQSSAFKRLKIDASELNRNANNSHKDCVTSSSDCKKSSRGKRNVLGNNRAVRDPGDSLVGGTVAGMHANMALNVIDNMVSSCQDALCVDVQSTGLEKSKPQSLISPGLPNLEDFYSKETKTLNTNVVSEFLQEITTDSEKFAKVDNRYRPPSKEINILQEAFGEEDKAEKILIGHRFGTVKDTNLYVQASATVVKPVRNSDPNVLNNNLDLEVTSMEVISKFAHGSAEVVSGENSLPLKLFPDSNKLDEEEKNVQMQAYTKFNTIPNRSNIRTDLIDSAPDPDGMEVDEADLECSDEDEIEVASHTSTVEECSSVPNCLRHCSPSEAMLANRSWDEYLAKNDSIIVSTFQGQFRSTVVCSECSHVSVTHEPFMYLSLPIPHAMEQQICVVYISQKKPPIRYLLNLLKTDKIGTAKRKLCELIDQEDGDIIMAEVLDSHISRILDNNILLKYVNTFNRKIYAFEIISIESDSTLSVDTVSSDQLPSRSRSDVPFTDGQVSNHSFDSVNVNSPSSRGTFDYTLSDTEPCEPSSWSQDCSARYLGTVDDACDGKCESTSDTVSAKGHWPCKNYSGAQTSWNLDDTSGETSTFIRGQDRAPLGSPASRDDQVNSCTSEYWLLKNVEDGKEPSDTAEDRGSGDETLVSETCSSRSILCESSYPVHHGSINSQSSSPHSCVEDEEDAAVNPDMLTANCSTVTTSMLVSSTVNISSHQQKSSGHNSQGGSRNLSRSCPSPDGASPTSEHETTLLGVAAKLEESSGSIFLHSQNDGDYGLFHEERTPDVTDASTSFSKKPGVGIWETSWSSFPVNTPSAPEIHTVPLDAPADHWKSCAICLEDLLDTDLLTHVLCNGIFCQNCLEMSLKHTADVTAFCCPICLHPANMCEDFVPLASASASKPKIRTLPMSIAYRHCVKDNTGSSTLQLFGHPNIVHMPSVMAGEALYSLIDRLVSPLLTSYSVMLTDGQGLACSRCTYSWHCTGCEIPREGEVTLQPSDCLTVHVNDTLPPDQVVDMQFVHEDGTMAGLRSSEPTTIMDCFGAFTQSELLDEHNPWYCPQCDKNQCAKKTMTVWRYPDNLIIHLKRFVYQDLSSTKVDTKVIFPQDGMDVRGFLSGPSSQGLVYDLYSIICHFGGASAGHYTCYAKHPLTSQWYYYNDETVSQQAPSSSEFSSGYVLYYQRQGTSVNFTLPQTLPCSDDEPTDSGLPSSSSTSSAYISRTGSKNNSAVVLFQPLPTSSQKRDDKPVNDDDEQGSPCDYDSLRVHFGSEYPVPHGELNAAGDNGAVHIPEPDSTFDFYS